VDAVEYTPRGIIVALVVTGAPIACQVNDTSLSAILAPILEVDVIATPTVAEITSPVRIYDADAVLADAPGPIAATVTISDSVDVTVPNATETSGAVDE